MEQVLEESEQLRLRLCLMADHVAGQTDTLLDTSQDMREEAGLPPREPVDAPVQDSRRE